MTIAEIMAELDRIESMDEDVRETEIEYLKECYTEIMGAK